VANRATVSDHLVTRFTNAAERIRGTFTRRFLRCAAFLAMPVTERPASHGLWEFLSNGAPSGLPRTLFPAPASPSLCQGECLAQAQSLLIPPSVCSLWSSARVRQSQCAFKVMR
jgi:hypothetical protein